LDEPLTFPEPDRRSGDTGIPRDLRDVEDATWNWASNSIARRGRQDVQCMDRTVNGFPTAMQRRVAGIHEAGNG
jgi:hypothetical protein